MLPCNIRGWHCCVTLEVKSIPDIRGWCCPVTLEVKSIPDIRGWCCPVTLEVRSTAGSTCGWMFALAACAGTNLDLPIVEPWEKRWCVLTVMQWCVSSWTVSHYHPSHAGFSAESICHGFCVCFVWCCVQRRPCRARMSREDLVNSLFCPVLCPWAFWSHQLCLAMSRCLGISLSSFLTSTPLNLVTFWPLSAIGIHIISRFSACCSLSTVPFVTG